jgi:hypothetical protein
VTGDRRLETGDRINEKRDKNFVNTFENNIFAPLNEKGSRKNGFLFY